MSVNGRWGMGVLGMAMSYGVWVCWVELVRGAHDCFGELFFWHGEEGFVDVGGRGEEGDFGSKVG